MRIRLRCRGRRATKAAHVVTEYAVMLREQLELVVPHARIQGEAMDQHQRGAGPHDLIVEPSMIDFREAALHVVIPPGTTDIRSYAISCTRQYRQITTGMSN